LSPMTMRGNIMLISYFAVKGSDVVPMRYIGMQECADGLVRLFDITTDLRGCYMTHPAKSTLSENTIVSYGYSIR
jgi:hypothetical protein